MAACGTLNRSSETRMWLEMMALTNAVTVAVPAPAQVSTVLAYRSFVTVPAPAPLPIVLA